MKVIIVSVGRLKAGPERQLCERYLERFQGLAKACGITGVKLVELAESNQRRPADRMAEEARHLLEAIPDPAHVIVLDERGASLTSAAFAQQIRRLREQGTAALVLMIGGPDGLAAEVRARAQLVLSFGQLTLPHQLVRALLFEQLYRAATQVTGHPYHRA